MNINFLIGTKAQFIKCIPVINEAIDRSHNVNLYDLKQHAQTTDALKVKIKDNYIKNKIISHKKILTTKFDLIILSPGIDINKCKLSKFLKKNIKKIYSDLDVFYSFFKISRFVCINEKQIFIKSTSLFRFFYSNFFQLFF